MISFPTALLGGLLLGTSVVIARRHEGSGFGWLGEDDAAPTIAPRVSARVQRPTVAPVAPPRPASSYDPARSNKAAYARTHLAKRFWGATVLSSQAAMSMDKLAARIRSSDPSAAAQAKSVASAMRSSASESGKLALNYDEAWVRNRMGRSGISLELGA